MTALFKIDLRGNIVLIHEGTVEPGIVIEAALLGGGTGRNAALHEELGVKHTLGQDVLVDRNIGVGLEVMQKGIFADKKLFGQRVKGQWFCDMRVDVPDDFADPVRLFCADSILSLNDAAYFQRDSSYAGAAFPGNMDHWKIHFSGRHQSSGEIHSRSLHQCDNNIPFSGQRFPEYRADESVQCRN